MSSSPPRRPHVYLETLPNICFLPQPVDDADAAADAADLANEVPDGAPVEFKSLGEGDSGCGFTWTHVFVIGASAAALAFAVAFVVRARQMSSAKAKEAKEAKETDGARKQAREGKSHKKKQKAST